MTTRPRKDTMDPTQDTPNATPVVHDMGLTDGFDTNDLVPYRVLNLVYTNNGPPSFPGDPKEMVVTVIRPFTSDQMITTSGIQKASEAESLALLLEHMARATRAAGQVIAIGNIAEIVNAAAAQPPIVTLFTLDSPASTTTLQEHGYGN